MEAIAAMAMTVAVITAMAYRHLTQETLQKEERVIAIAFSIKLKALKVRDTIRVKETEKQQTNLRMKEIM
jgi:hypothetical protein